MEYRSAFALTVTKSENAQDWQPFSVGDWSPPDEPTLNGETLPVLVLEHYRDLKKKGFGHGGTDEIHFQGLWYRFDLVKKWDTAE